MGRSGRLFLLLRPYALLFVANLVATFVASVMDGATFVLLIPFLRTLFGHDPLNVAGGSAVERLLAVVVGPLFAAGSPGAALRNVVLVLVAAMVIKNVLAYLASVSSVAIQENVVRDILLDSHARDRRQVREHVLDHHRSDQHQHDVAQGGTGRPGGEQGADDDRQQPLHG